ncbi:MAG: 50S ribosomal protein L32 [Planctomycetia bacterium]|nr:50S ribosomal protein L32 [Planctomycetia bacterium]
MAVPKRRTTRRTRGQRNSHSALAVPALSTCDNCNYKRPPHRVCPNCGQYAKRQVVEKE